jgi:hypothetical protein
MIFESIGYVIVGFIVTIAIIALKRFLKKGEQSKGADDNDEMKYINAYFEAWVCGCRECEKTDNKVGTPCIVVSSVYPHCKGANWNREKIFITADCENSQKIANDSTPKNCGACTTPYHIVKIAKKKEK